MLGRRRERPTYLRQQQQQQPYIIGGVMRPPLSAVPISLGYQCALFQAGTTCALLLRGITCAVFPRRMTCDMLLTYAVGQHALHVPTKDSMCPNLVALHSYPPRPAPNYFDAVIHFARKYAKGAEETRLTSGSL